MKTQTIKTIRKPRAVVKKGAARPLRKRVAKKKGNLMDGIRGWIFQEAKKSVHDRVNALRDRAMGFLRLLTFRFLLAVFSFVGVVFLLVGMSQYLAGVLHTPGAAEVLVGATILSLSAVLFVFVGDERKESME